MRFYFLEAELIEKDLQAFLNDGSFDKVMEELQAIRKDLMVCELLLPEQLESGIFLSKTADIKALLCDTVSKRLEKLKEKCMEAFISSIEQTEQLYEQAWEAMRPHNKDIETYIRLYDYVRSDQYKKILLDIENYVMIAQRIYAILEEGLVEVPLELLMRYYQMRISSTELKTHSEKLLKILQGNKVKYEEQLNKEKVHLMTDFARYKDALKSFENFDAILDYFSENKERVRKEEAKEFGEIVERTRKMNTYRQKLDLHMVDMKEIEEYYNLWVFCENLAFVRKRKTLFLTSFCRGYKYGKLV